jgi:hypothetical protein
MAITNGNYRAKACGQVVLGESSKKGTPFIELYFEITKGEKLGGRVRWTSYFSEKTNERTIESLQYCGWKGDDLGEFSDGKLHGLDTNEVEIAIELEEYQDKEGNPRLSPRVQWVNRGGGGYLNLALGMTPAAAVSFGDRMRGLVLALKEKNPQGTGTDFPHGANASVTTTTAPEGAPKKAF